VDGRIHPRHSRENDFGTKGSHPGLDKIDLASIARAGAINTTRSQNPSAVLYLT